MTGDDGPGVASSGSGGGTGSGSGGSSGGASTSGGGNGGGSSSGGGGSSSGSSGAADAGLGWTSGPADGGCGQTLPALSDYSKMGPFATTIQTTTGGPDGGYTVVQPMTLGQNGFKHPVATWGNGITTTPTTYTSGNPALLQMIASHGIVVIASNSSSVTSADMVGGLDWMVAQNAASGPYQGKLDTKCLVSIGYSLGGGAAVATGAHADVVTTVAFHPVNNTPALHGPLLLWTSTTDTVNTPAVMVTPIFNASTVQTFYGTVTAAGDPKNEGHLLPASELNLLDPVDPEYAPTMAWLRMWLYGDQGGRSYFWGTGALACQNPNWQCQTKNPPGAAQMSGF
ncbi:MAG: hypothetical protein ACHQNA_10720 [Acidimicrobiales bacterium]